MTRLETEKLKEGIRLFREGHYFDAHDVWEEVWQNLSGNRKLFWQSLIQLSVACYHIENGNRKGAEGMLEKASQKIFSLQSQKSDKIFIQFHHLFQVLKNELESNIISSQTADLLNAIVTDDLLDSV